MINLAIKPLILGTLISGVLTLPFTVVQAQENPTLEQQVAERLRAAEDQDFISLSIENDLFGGGSDQFYTSGLRLSWFNVNTDVPSIIDEIADHVPTFDINDTTSTTFSIGQNIYTPENIRLRTNQDNDRPWAAFLYGSVGLASIENNHVDELEVTLGVVGPEALGEQTQKVIHRHLSNSPTPKGWNNQLNFEPGIIVSAQRRWPEAFQARLGDFHLRAVPNVNTSLGNVYTYAGTGVTFVFGPYDDRFYDTPPRVRPAIPGTGYFEAPKHGLGWHVFAALDGRAVVRNIFLDGNMFSSSHSVDKKPLVGDAVAGVAFALDRYQLSYSLNARSKEFDGQDSESVFGSITLSTRF